jgi:hypothetical protein
MEIPEPVIPKEHGAWAVLFVPLVTGAAIAGGLSENVLLLGLSVLSVFLWTVPAQTLLRHVTFGPRQEAKLRGALFWGGVYLLFAIAFLIPLFARGYWLLAPIGFAGAGALFAGFIRQGRSPRTIAADIVSILGLTLSGLAACYVSSGTLSLLGITVWILSAVFFISSVFYVHMKIGSISSKNRRMHPGLLRMVNIMYQAGVLLALTLLAIAGMTRWITVVAFIPMAAHVLYGTVRPSIDVEFKKLGLLLLAHSILFGIILWISLR